MPCGLQFWRCWCAARARRSLHLPPRRGIIRSAFGDATSAAASATASLRATSNASPRPPGATPLAPLTPITTTPAPTPNYSPIASSNREGGTDACSCSGDSCDRNGVGGRACGRPNLLPGLSGLPARLRQGHLLRMPLYVAGAVQRDGFRARGAVRGQSVFRECRTAGGALPAASPRLLS